MREMYNFNCNGRREKEEGLMPQLLSKHPLNVIWFPYLHLIMELPPFYFIEVLKNVLHISAGDIFGNVEVSVFSPWDECVCRRVVGSSYLPTPHWCRPQIVVRIHPLTPGRKMLSLQKKRKVEINKYMKIYLFVSLSTQILMNTE